MCGWARHPSAGGSNKTIDEAKLAIADMEGDIFWFFLALKMQ
jgi:hypothetical protein